MQKLLTPQLLIIGSAFFSRLAVYLTLIVAARLLDPQQFGIFGLGITVAGILAGTVSGGDMWLNRFSRMKLVVATTYPIWQAYIWATLRMAALVGFVVVGLGLLFFDPGPAQRHIIFAIIMVGVAMGFGECIFAMLRAQGNVARFFALRDLAIPAGILGLMLVLRPDTAFQTLLFHMGAWASLALVGFMLIWNNLQLNRLDINRRRVLHTRAMKHHFSLALSNLSARLSAYFDILALAWFTPIAFVGEYRVSAQIAIGFWIVQHFLFLGLPWQMRHKPDGRAEAAEAVLQRQRLLVVASIAGYVLLAVLAVPLLRLFGDRFEETANLFRLILAVRLCDVLWGPQHEMMVSNGLAREDSWANLIAIALWPVFFLIFLGFEPYAGAAITAVCLSSTVGHLYRHRVMVARRLPPCFGQPAGMVLPLGCAVAITGLSWAL